MFYKLVHALNLVSFPPPCIALIVTKRFNPIILFEWEMLILAEKAYNQINAMQARWAKRLLLDIAAITYLRARITIAQLKWTPLATKTKERAIVSLAKVQLLPPGHSIALLNIISNGF